MRLNWESWIDATHASRVAAGRNALQKLGMDYADLDRIGHAQVEELQQIFLTSSSVQGLSTHKSDIDLIAVGEIGDDEDRAPAQLFMQGRRFELIVFNRAEVDRTMATLSTVAQSGI